MSETFSSEPDAQTRWRQATGLLARRSYGRVLVATRDTAEPMVFEGSALVIWDELVAAKTDDELSAAVARRYGMDGDATRDEVIGVRRALTRAGAIVSAS